MGDGGVSRMRLATRAGWEICATWNRPSGLCTVDWYCGEIWGHGWNVPSLTLALEVEDSFFDGAGGDGFVGVDGDRVFY